MKIPTTVQELREALPGWKIIYRQYVAYGPGRTRRERRRVVHLVTCALPRPGCGEYLYPKAAACTVGKARAVEAAWRAARIAGKA